MPFVEQGFKPEPVVLDGLAADLSPRGLREHAFRVELERIAEGEQRKAARKRAAAARLPLNSNGRAKRLAEAGRLEEHAETLLAATVEG
jgi:hypothetical protein